MLASHSARRAVRPIRLAGIVVALASTLGLAGPALAGTHVDGTADNCKNYGPPSPDPICGSDISSASDTTDSNGAVRFQVSYAAMTCHSPNFAIAFEPIHPGIEIYDTAVSTPTGVAPHLLVELMPTIPIGHYLMRRHNKDGSTTDSTLPASASAAGATTTVSVTIPAAVADSLGTFRWMTGNSCLPDRQAYLSTDLAPDTGLYQHAGRLTLTMVKAAVATTLGAAKPKQAAALLTNGGFRVTCNAPAGGTLTAKLTTKRGKRTVTIASLKVTVGKEGKVRRTVALTKAGRKLLRRIRKPLSAKLTITFKSGSLSATKSRNVTLAPRR